MQVQIQPLSKSDFRGFLLPKHWEKKNVSLFKKTHAIAPTNKVRILQYELNWDFRYGVDTCLQKMKSLGIDFSKLTSGNCIAFVNTKKNRVRLLTIDRYGQAVSIVKACPRMDVRALKHLPEAFNGPSLDMDKATSKFLDVFFATKRKQAELILS